MVYFMVSQTQLFIALGIAAVFGLGLGLIAGAVLGALPPKEQK